MVKKESFLVKETVYLLLCLKNALRNCIILGKKIASVHFLRYEHSLSHGNTYDFFEVPQPRAVVKKNDTSLVINSDEHLTRTANDVTDAAKNCTAEDREINNRADITNKEEIRNYSKC